MYDIIVIGGGPAGISAAIYAASRGKKTLVLEKDKVGGIIGKVSTVTHYTAIVEGETGATFARRMESQALAAGVEIAREEVIGAKLVGAIKEIRTAGNTYLAPRVIIAGGSSPRKLGVPGEKELSGIGMGMNAARDGEAYRGKNIYVVGGADGAVKEALYLARFAKTLTIIHFEEKLGCIPEFAVKVAAADNIKLMLRSRLTAVGGSGRVEWLEITNEDNGAKQKIQDDGCGIFVYAGTVPNSDIYRELELENGFIPVDEKMRTAIDGVYAAGDIRVKQLRQVATAVADGAIAAVNAAL